MLKSSECECPRGAYKCSHAAALFIHEIYNMSRKDIEKKQKTAYISQVFIAEMFFPTTAGYTAKTRQPKQEDRDVLYSVHRKYRKFSGLCWLLSPEPKPQKQFPVPITEELIFSEEFLSLSTTTEQLKFIKRKLKVTKETII